MRVDKDPDARLDYKYNWLDWLADTETITAKTVTAPSLTVETPTVTDAGKSVTVWLSGGNAGSTVEATCHITTSLGRQDDRTIVLNITDR